MATITVDNAVIVAVAGLLAKETTMGVIKLLGKNRGNGKNTLRGLLEDIRGQGKVTLDKVGAIEKEQGNTKVILERVTTEMTQFKQKCEETDERIDTLDQRFFDHIRRSGG